MVRKISNKKELKQKKQEKKVAKDFLKKNPVMTTEQIDKEINDNLFLLEKFLSDEEKLKIKLLIDDSSDPNTMARIFTVIKEIRNKSAEDKVTDEFLLNMKKQINLILQEYEKNYLPTLTTLIYLTLLGINKAMGRYFGINYYKRNFSKDNKQYKYTNECYKKNNAMLKNYPIKIDKNRVFSGIWEQKIKGISKSLNKLLCRLDRFRDLYIINEPIETELKRLRGSVEAVGLTEDEELTNKEIKYIRKVFGPDMLEEMKEHYSKPIQKRYVYEYNFIKDLLFYSSILSSERHLSVLRKELAYAIYMRNGNSFLTEDIIQNVKNIFKELNTFVLNFADLVDHGEETYTENRALPIVQLNGERISVRFKK